MPKFADYRDAYQTIKLERNKDGILQMTLHNKGGPYTWDFAGIVRDESRQNTGGAHDELADALSNIARDPDNKIVILTGTGDLFSGPPASDATFPRGGPEFWEHLQFHGNQLLLDLFDIPGPVISCINGPAYRHAELPFAADIVLAAEDALIQDSAHFRNNVVPGDGIGVVLPFLMGWNRGRYFLMMGQKLSAAEMKEIGLVNEVLPRERLLPRAWEIAEQFIKKNPLVLRYTRQMLTAPIKALLRQHLGHGHALEALGAVHESAKRGG
jgi:enoyl-CoA hydratase/carnithine racemase